MYNYFGKFQIHIIKILDIKIKIQIQRLLLETYLQHGQTAPYKYYMFIKFGVILYSLPCIIINQPKFLESLASMIEIKKNI